jgi:hypothetical protein
VRLCVADSAVFSVTFGPEPESIAVAADPSSGIDVHTRAASVRLPFELIEQHEVVQRPVVDSVSSNVGERSFAVLISQWWNESRQLRKRVLVLRMIDGFTGRGFLLARGLGLGFVLFVSGVLRETRRTAEDEKREAGEGSVKESRHSTTLTSRNIPASM